MVPEEIFKMIELFEIFSELLEKFDIKCVVFLAILVRHIFGVGEFIVDIAENLTGVVKVDFFERIKHTIEHNFESFILNIEFLHQ